MSRTYRILIAAGGTGGHIFPAIAIADALRSRSEETEIAFVGTKNHMEWFVVPNAGYPIYNIWISGIHRRITPKNLMFPMKLGVSLWQSRGILEKFKPDIVIGCGGYVTGPIGYEAYRAKIPLVLQEQNSYPGLTNRLLSRYAKLIFTAFPQADRFFPENRTLLCGNPTRKSLQRADAESAYSKFGFVHDKHTLLILGGSGGARTINMTILNNLDALHNELDLQIIWQCGTRYYDTYKKEIQLKKYPRLILIDFLEHMPEAYKVSDLVISRAGASSCAELMVLGKPSILVPSPNVAGDHQTKNARAMVENGAAILIKDNEFDQRLIEETRELVGHPDRLKMMSEAALKLAKPDAADRIAAKIMEIITKNNNVEPDVADE